MTRKHYIKIADAINSSFVEGEQYYKFEIAQIIANALRGTNPAYDSARFYNAAMGNTKKRVRRTTKKAA